MGKFIDKKNKKYNMLLVKEYCGDGYWLCDCDCGNKNIKVLSTLLNEDPNRRKKKSCGCLMKKNIPEKEDYFSKIDSDEKAYILGFIAADGSINKKFKKIKIDLKRDDEEILKKIQRAIGHNNFLYYYEQKNIKFKNSDKIYTSKTARLVIHSERMIKDLEKLGVIENKTYILDINLDLIPNKFFFSFLRGLIDGDGCISFSSEKKYIDLNLTTSDIMGNKIIKWLNDNYEHKNFFIKTYRNKGNLKTVTLVNTCYKYILPLLDEMYLDATIYLERKYKKYTEIKNFYNSNDYPKREYK